MVKILHFKCRLSGLALFSIYHLKSMIKPLVITLIVKSVLEREIQVIRETDQPYSKILILHIYFFR